MQVNITHTNKNPNTAAAPELLEFAENMSSYLKDIIADKNHPINWRNECEILLNNCNQAITKSKGE